VREVVPHPDAEDEALELARFNEARTPGLGQAFLDEVEHASRWIAESPQRWPRLRGGMRKILLRRFPFALIYREEEDAILLLAVMHQHREPDYLSSADRGTSGLCGDVSSSRAGEERCRAR
jgi:plasmid stabilization system protein ParE